MRVGTTLWLASFVFASLALGLAACGDGGTKATCDDGARNGAETGVDCGGGCGVACPVGQGCDGPSDCLSGVCSTVNLCACGPGTVANASGGCDAVDPCGNAPCKNGGTCAAVGTGFSCTCAAGWSGDTCTTNVDDCAPSPCENGGVCVDGVDGYTCTCAAGYYGDTCGSACEVGNCAAGTVTCDADGTNRQCGACQAGWTGTTCADDDDECATGHDDCDEHAICANTVPGFTCTCEAGYDGDGASCAPCADGTWGEGCGESCVGGQCVGTIDCDPVDGGNPSCAACQPGATGPACAEACEAGHCANGAVTCAQDGSGRQCTDGCEAGWYGAGCDSACVGLGCARGVGLEVACDQATGATTSCTACESGFTGPDCAATCTQGNCNGHPVCAQSDPDAERACPEGCVAGFYGVDCGQSCPAGHCAAGAVCAQNNGALTSCGACQTGYWGTACQNGCDTPTRCSPSGTVTCDKASGAATACSACNAGWFGPVCASTCVISHCAGGAVCAQGGAPESCGLCDPGWHGTLCDQPCDAGFCEEGVTCNAAGELTACTRCAAGHWGADCSGTCELAACSGPPICHQGTGTPQSCSSCPDGAWGTLCEKTCANAQCDAGIRCTQDLGTTTSCGTCQPGFWGPTCASACELEGCLGQVTCDKVTGARESCTDCPVGTYGDNCGSVCAQGHCAGPMTCEHLTGVATACDSSCVTGYYGVTCAQICQQGDCTGAVTCAKGGDGAPTSCTGCTAGHFGATCTDLCYHDHCSVTRCAQDGGAVTSCEGCAPGWTGPTCDAACALDTCASGLACAQDDGAATACAACVRGYHGALCGEACVPGHCVDPMCDRVTGANTDCASCEPGYRGPVCADACPALHCGPGEVVCDRVTGDTISCESCADGFSGPKCDQAPHASCLAWKDAGATEDRLYWIDPDGPGGPIGSVEVYCDMTNGGYTYLKVDYGGAATAVDAEAYCAARGLQLFIPRTKAHLASAFAVATSGAIGPSGSKLYLYIMGIYPKAAGSKCEGIPLHSGNPACAWEASDGGSFWVSNRTDVAEPNGDNAVTSSMFYDFDDAGNAIAWNDTEASYTSRYFMCDTGDTDFLFASCKQWFDAAFQTNGPYLLDFDGRLGPATPLQYACDMANGGYTQILAWDRAQGDTVATFKAKMTAVFDNMGLYVDQTDDIRWSDHNANADVLHYKVAAPFPNAGQVRLDIHYQGWSMEDSGTWIYGLVGGTQKNIACGDYVTGQGNFSSYTTTEQSHFPSYSCNNAQATSATWTWNQVFSASLGGAMSEWHIVSFHYDSDGDFSYLWKMNVGVR